MKPSISPILLLFLAFAGNLHAEIDEKRQFQLDSISTNIPKESKQNLDEVHAFLHQNGHNDEERIWLFYGYIATHFKYDYKRKGEKDAPFFSPEYTAQRRSGVCRDFSKVFQVLCDKSGIPCLEVTGRTPISVWEVIGNWLHRISSTVTHRWNVVKLNGTWVHMDPTWSSVLTTHKIKHYDAKKKVYYTVQVKVPARTYYNPDPVFMMETHAPVHPAFLLISDSLPTFKTARKKEARQKFYCTDYHFNDTIDLIYAAKFPMFSKTYYKGCMAYSKEAGMGYNYEYELSLPVQKIAKYKQPTLEQYDEALLRARELTSYIKEQTGIAYSGKLKLFEEDLAKKRAKLAKKLEAEAKAKKKPAPKPVSAQ
ncbi:MAG TPA: transglutaminase domain-containing protein [Fluviicola sp.]|nr:transglutaminase domain-containing protein [Fluviicola sp.]